MVARAITSVAAAGGVIAGGWAATAAVGALAFAVLAGAVWVLASENHTARLVRVIDAVRGRGRRRP